jgi:hypothetical protein
VTATACVHVWEPIEGWRSQYRCVTCQRTGYGTGRGMQGPPKEHAKQDRNRYHRQNAEPNVRPGTEFKKPSLEDYDRGPLKGES